MNLNIIDEYLLFQKNNIINYFDFITKLFLKEKKLTKEKKTIYLKKAKEISNIYTREYFFSNNKIINNLKNIVKNLNDDDTLIIINLLHICIKLNNIKINTKLKYKVEDILKELNILKNKNYIDLINKIINLIKISNLKENNFLKKLNDNDYFYNTFLKLKTIDNTYIIKFNLNIKELKIYNDLKIDKIVNKDLKEKLNLISLQYLNITILKQLILFNQTDNFIVKIDKQILKNNKLYNNLLKITNQKNIKNAIIFLIDYELSEEFSKEINNIKKLNYKIMLNVNNKNFEKLDSKEVLLIDNKIKDNLNLLNNKFIIKDILKEIKEKDLLNGKDVI